MAAEGGGSVGEWQQREEWQGEEKIPSRISRLLQCGQWEESPGDKVWLMSPGDKGSQWEGVAYGRSLQETRCGQSEEPSGANKV